MSVGAAAGSPYSVTASVSDGGLSSSVSFTWTASEAQGPVSLVLSRSEVRFGDTENGAITTGAQEVWVLVIGSDTLSWTATSSDPTVVQVSPSSGTGTLTIAINQSRVYADTLAGDWTVTVEAGGASNSPQVVQVPFRVYPAGQTTVPFGAFDTPTDQATGLAGSVAVTGWALDDIEVTRVELWRDAFGSEATYPPFKPCRPISRTAPYRTTGKPCFGPGRHGKVFIGTSTFVDGSRPDVEWQNATDESFNGKFRDEYLGLQWFRNRVDAKVGIEQWRRHYNEVRPHSSLGYLTPAEFKAQQIADWDLGGPRKHTTTD